MSNADAAVQEAFGRVLRRLRLEAHLSQEALGYRASLHRNYVSELERGRKAATLPTLFSLAAALDIAPQGFIAAVEEEIRS